MWKYEFSFLIQWPHIDVVGKRRGGKGKAERKKSSVTEEEGNDSDEAFHPARRGAKAKPKLSFSSDEEDDAEDIIQTQSAATAKGKHTNSVCCYSQR